jgi:hypothetical protein
MKVEILLGNIHNCHEIISHNVRQRLLVDSRIFSFLDSRSAARIKADLISPFGKVDIS